MSFLFNANKIKLTFHRSIKIYVKIEKKLSYGVTSYDCIGEAWQV